MGRLSMVMIAVGVSMVAVIALALLLPDMGERILHVLMPHASIAVMTLALALAMLLLCSWSSAEIVPPGKEVVMSSADDAASSHYIYDSVNSDGHPRNMGENKHFSLSLSPEVESLLLPIEFSDFPPLVPSEAPDDFIRILSIRERLRNVARTIDLMDDMRLSPAVEDILLPLEFSDCPPLVPRDSSDVHKTIEPHGSQIVSAMAESLQEEGPVITGSSVDSPYLIPDDDPEEAIGPDPIIGADEATMPSVSDDAATSPAEEDDASPSIDDFFAGLTEEELAFWSGFYIAGEDEIVLADGLYYMDLYINDSFTGVIGVTILDGEPSIDRGDLVGYLRDTITDEAFDRIFTFTGDAIAFSYLDEIGIRTTFDSEGYEVRIFFMPEDMPIQILSLTGGMNAGRRRSRPIADGIDLEPAVFAVESTYNLTGRVSNFRNDRWLNNMAFTFSSSNHARLYDLHLDFNYYMNFGINRFLFNFGSYRFYYDFPDEMIRLSFGNVSSDLLSPDGTSVGVEFEKSYAFAPSGYIRPSHYEQLIVIEKPSDVEIFNEGRSIFHRTLDVGTYRLRDFILYSGANRITVRVTPLDGSPVQEIDMDLLYSGSLLAPHEVYYGASLVTGRSIVSSASQKGEGKLRLPIWGGRSLEYDLRDWTLSSFVRAGLTPTLTLDTTIAIQNDPSDIASFRPNARMAAELIHANFLGTTRYLFNASERTDENGAWQMPGFYASIGHQISTDWRGLSSVTITGSYYSPRELGIDGRHRFSLSGGLSGRVGIMSWSVNASGSLYSDIIKDSTWYLSSSLSFSLSRNVWLTASGTMQGDFDSAPQFSGRISASIRFGRTNTSVTLSDTTSYATFRYSDSRHSFTMGADTSRFGDFNRYGFDADYAYSGDYINASLGLDAGSSFNAIGADFRLSTASVFADGLMAFNAHVPTNYLLISQKGALKDNDISIGSPGSSVADRMDSFLGVSLYEGLSAGNYDDSFIIYSEGENGFAPLAMYPVNVPSSTRRGYVLRLDAPNTYPASGIVTLPDGQPWINGSSPIYSISMEEGEVRTEPTDEYLFTDSDGRFVTQTLEPGTYGFDVPYDGGWILMMFTIQDLADSIGCIQLVDQGSLSTELRIPEVYSSSIMFTFDQAISSDAFFDLLYGGAA